MSFFPPQYEGSLLQWFMSLQHDRTMAEYRDKFWTLAASCHGLADDAMFTTFFKGLRGFFSSKLILLGPLTLEVTIENALRIEEKIKE